MEFSKDPEMIARLRHTQQVVNESDDRTDPVKPVRMLITYTITVPPDVVPEGETIRCWDKTKNKQQETSNLQY